MYRLSIRDLLDGFSDGTLSCEAYTRRVIQRAQDLKVFNHFVSMDTDRMLKNAQEADARYKSKTNRPLEGILIAMKDNIDIQGQVTGAGTPGLAGLKAKHTAEVARRLFDAGAIPAGRTVMHELARGSSTTNPYTGDSHNFHNFDYTCGGSSGGSAGAVAADIVPAALGTDTAGSIRIPASYSGVYGLRPTSKRWPSNYGLKFTHLRDSVGPLARSLEDIAILDQVMTGEEAHPELLPTEIRIGVPRSHFWEGLDPEVKECAEQFLVSVKEKGFVVIEQGGIPGLAEIFRDYLHPSINHEIVAILQEYIQYHGHNVTMADIAEKIATPVVKEGFGKAMNNPPSEEVVQSAMEARDKLIHDVQKYFQDHRLDCILMPASKIPAPTLSAFKSEKAGELLVIVENHDCANVCNNPSLVIPGGYSRASGVPFGMQIEGLSGSDSRLIAVARAIQNALQL
ncbi:mandelamide hydrolase-like isoform X2 [Patiria miniata]|nr:mandelamide hydrolase-like isoform X2 [Patiria miniata]XP_038047718.1 mandelamide hydrolase-like isoform X2 [Patiria miniata]